MDIGAALFSLLLPGAGHFVKGKIGEGLGWGAAFLFCCFYAITFWPAAIGAAAIYICAPFSAYKAKQTNLPEM